MLVDVENSLDSTTAQPKVVNQPEYFQRETVIGTRIADDALEQRGGHGRSEANGAVVCSRCFFVACPLKSC